jgi:hypothetical protein
MGDKESLLSGSGTSDEKFKDHAYSISGSLAALSRMVLNWRSDKTAPTPIRRAHKNRAATSRVAGDFNFNADGVVPYIGGTVGHAYGDVVDGTWVAGPEAGLKLFVEAAAAHRIVLRVRSPRS